MSDMQKVRVSLTDADGKVHEVVGYQYQSDPAAIYQSQEADDWVIQLMNEDAVFAVTPIQELPTGLGAVVEVRWDDPEGPLTTERYVRIGDATWFTPEMGEDVSDKFLKAQEFTVLSEGVK